MEKKEVLLTKNQEVLGKEPVMVDLESRRDSDKLPTEVESWMTRVERITPKPVQSDDGSSQQWLTPTTPTTPTTVVPVTRKTFATGFKKKVSDAGRWLSEYIFRLIKIKKGEVKFNQE